MTHASSALLRRRVLRACAAGVALVAAVAGGPAQAATPTGAVLWTDSVGDAAPVYLDASQGNVDCADGKLTFQIAVPNLSEATMNKTLSYYVYRTKWTVGSTTYFADAALGWSQSVKYKSFASGVFLPDGTPVLMNAATGDITSGASGLAKVTIRGADVQLPSAGTASMRSVTGQTLTYPFYTFFLGGPTPVPGGKVVDTGGPGLGINFNGGCTIV